MRPTRHGLLIVGVAVFAMLVASVALAAPSRPQKPMLERPAVATELAAASRLALETSAPFDKAVLTVSGPKDFRIRREFAAGQAVAVDLAAADFADGRYRYTLRVSPKTDSGAIKMGMFFVENGAIVSRESKRSQLDTIRDRLNLSRRQKVQEAADKLGSKREVTPGSRPGKVRRPRSESRVAPSPEGMPPYYPYYYGGLFGGYVGIFGYGPLLYFYEIPYYYPGPAGYYPPYGMTGFMMQYYGNNYRISQYANYDYAYYNINSGIYNIDVGYGNYSYGYYNYDYGVRNVRYASYVNADIGYVNYRYALYGQNFSVAYGVDYGYGFYGGYNVIIGAGYDLGAGGNDLGVYSFEYQTLVVGPRGVGVGTYQPTADFEITDYGYAAMRLYSYMGGARFAFSATPLGVFTVNQIGTGGQEFTVSERFDANGPTVDVQGSVKGTQFIASSSRELKTDFATVDGKKVLSKLSEVPVMSWRYKNEDGSVRHFGPVAEDFRAAFQLGDGQTISNVDADGVAMAAIQGLHQLIQEQGSSLEQQQADLSQRDREIAELRATVARLEETLLQLAADKQ